MNNCSNSSFCIKAISIINWIQDKFGRVATNLRYSRKDLPNVHTCINMILFYCLNNNFRDMFFSLKVICLLVSSKVWFWSPAIKRLPVAPPQQTTAESERNKEDFCFPLWECNKWFVFSVYHLTDWHWNVNCHSLWATSQ